MQIRVEVSAAVINYDVFIFMLVMYKLKGSILSVTIVSLLDFNNTGWDGPTVCGPAWPGPLKIKPGPASLACFLL